MHLAATILSALAFLALALTLGLHLASWRFLRRRPPTRRGDAPPVSILKPLKGVDCGLLENLLSFADLHYPRFQLVLGVEDPADPALAVAHELRALRPELDLAIAVGAPPFGRNPKITNLAAMAGRARFSLWWISDSNVRARPGDLDALVAELERPGVAMVTSPFAGTGARSLGARLENLHLNSLVVPGMAASELFLGKPVVVGKSMLFDRRDLDRIGGLHAVRDILAEDYVLGEWFQQAGMGVVTSPRVIETRNEHWTPARFLSRHLRWGMIRRRLQPIAFVAEPLHNPVLFACLALLAGGPATLLLVIGAKVLADGLLGWRLTGRAPHPAELLLIPPKDLAIALLWPLAAVRQELRWRGNRLRVAAGTLLVEPQPAHGPRAAADLCPRA
jgi:ceramide glucosyltransferase